MTLEELLEKTYSYGLIISDAFTKADSVINDKGYCNMAVSVSGGADSDIMLDMVARLDKRSGINVHYVFFDTGIEYQATKDHLDELEKKYGIHIERVPAAVPVPLGCFKYGLPFLSKTVSENISYLQAHNFQWEDDDYATLVDRYCERNEDPEEIERLEKQRLEDGSEYIKPWTYVNGGWYKGCISGLKWWCNEKKEPGTEEVSRFCIAQNRYLKEFMMQNPPTFKISKKCCDGAKKRVSARYTKIQKIDLMLIGVRKAEGGQRSSSYKGCFSPDTHYGCAQYRPIFWYTGKEKRDYEEIFEVVHSRCYTEYMLDRTGCCGCPYNKNYEQDLERIRESEPALYRAVTNIFRASYKYTRAYREFCKKKKAEKKQRAREGRKEEMSVGKRL